MNDEDINDEETICQNISRLTFKFITRIIQQVNFRYKIKLIYSLNY